MKETTFTSRLLCKNPVNSTLTLSRPLHRGRELMAKCRLNN